MRQDLKVIGERLTRIRGQASQAVFGPIVGIHKNTMGTYERGEREIGALALSGYVSQGWNANWILTGQGAERLEAFRANDDIATPPASQALSQERLTLALQAVEDALTARRATLPTSKRAEAVMLVYELLGTGLAEAEVIPIARRAVGLAQGGPVDDVRGAAAARR